MTGKERLQQILDDESYGLYPAPTEAQLAVNVLIEYLLGEDWYVVDPIHNSQVNTVAVHEILMKYSRKYRKEQKRRDRQRKTDCADDRSKES